MPYLVTKRKSQQALRGPKRSGVVYTDHIYWCNSIIAERKSNIVWQKCEKLQENFISI